MEFIGGFFIAIFGLLILAMVFGLIYKWRDGINEFFKDPEAGADFQRDRRKILARKIEDAQDEIAWITERREKKNTKPETDG